MKSREHANFCMVKGWVHRDPMFRKDKNDRLYALFEVKVPPETYGEKQWDFIECRAFHPTSGHIENIFMQAGDYVLITGLLRGRFAPATKRRYTYLDTREVYILRAADGRDAKETVKTGPGADIRSLIPTGF